MNKLLTLMLLILLTTSVQAQIQPSSSVITVIRMTGTLTSKAEECTEPDPNRLENQNVSAVLTSVETKDYSGHKFKEVTLALATSEEGFRRLHALSGSDQLKLFKIDSEKKAVVLDEGYNDSRFHGNLSEKSISGSFQTQHPQFGKSCEMNLLLTAD